MKYFALFSSVPPSARRHPMRPGSDWLGTARHGPESQLRDRVCLISAGPHTHIGEPSRQHAVLSTLPWRQGILVAASAGPPT